MSKKNTVYMNINEDDFDDIYNDSDSDSDDDENDQQENDIESGIKSTSDEYEIGKVRIPGVTDVDLLDKYKAPTYCEYVVQKDKYLYKQHLHKNAKAITVMNGHYQKIHVKCESTKLEYNKAKQKEREEIARITKYIKRGVHQRIKQYKTDGLSSPPMIKVLTEFIEEDGYATIELDNVCRTNEHNNQIQRRITIYKKQMTGFYENIRIGQRIFEEAYIIDTNDDLERAMKKMGKTLNSKFIDRMLDKNDSLEYIASSMEDNQTIMKEFDERGNEVNMPTGNDEFKQQLIKNLAAALSDTNDTDQLNDDIQYPEPPSNVVNTSSSYKDNKSLEDTTMTELEGLEELTKELLPA